MKHLIRNANRTFDVVTVGKNGQYLNGTNQGFEHRSGAINNMRAVMKVDDIMSTQYQDDTKEKPMVYMLFTLGSVHPCPDAKTEKKYIPKK